MSQCPTCGNLVAEGAAVCGECGIELKSAAGGRGAKAGRAEAPEPVMSARAASSASASSSPSASSSASASSPAAQPFGGDDAHGIFSFDFESTVSHRAAQKARSGGALTSPTPGSTIQVGEPSEEAPMPITATLTLVRAGIVTASAFSLAAPAVIGRFDSESGPVDIDLGQLPEAIYVSRHHAEIRHESGGWTLKDLGSRNGTFIRGSHGFARVTGETPLENGAEIALGNARFLFQF